MQGVCSFLATVSSPINKNIISNYVLHAIVHMLHSKITNPRNKFLGTLNLLCIDSLRSIVPQLFTLVPFLSHSILCCSSQMLTKIFLSGQCCLYSERMATLWLLDLQTLLLYFWVSVHVLKPPAPSPSPRVCFRHWGGKVVLLISRNTPWGFRENVSYWLTHYKLNPLSTFTCVHT